MFHIRVVPPTSKDLGCGDSPFALLRHVCRNLHSVRNVHVILFPALISLHVAFQTRKDVMESEYAKRILTSLGQLEQDEGALSFQVRSELERAMLPSSLVSSFLTESFAEMDTELREKYHCLEMDDVKECFSLFKGKSKLLQQMADIMRAHCKDYGARLCRKEGDELLRAFLILLECPALDVPEEKWSRDIVCQLGGALVKLKHEGEENFAKLVAWWRHDSQLMERAVLVFLQAFKAQHASSGYNHISSPECQVEVLKLLNKMNEDSNFIVPVDRFYLGDFNGPLNVLEEHFFKHLRNEEIKDLPRISKELCLVDLPFLLSSSQKFEMFNNITAHLQRLNMQRRFVPRLGLEVDRDHILKSAMSEVSKLNTAYAFASCLEIHFTGDVSLGVNGGGPMKEFFSRFFEELLKSGMFKKVDDSPTCTTYWFNQEYNKTAKLKCAGLLFTLMFHNNGIVTLPFPHLLYKKLLTKSKFSLDDLRLLQPETARSLESLHDMSADELAGMDLTFTVDNSKGKSVELKKGGANVTVTHQNLQEYTELYARYITAGSQFEAFSTSFKGTCHFKRVKQFFRPQELMAIFLGGEYDWASFQKSFRYEKGYTANHQVIKMFWEVFHNELDEETKKEFLAFMTGARHVPVGGFRYIGPRMWPLGGVKASKGNDPPKDICPEVNTCHGYVVLHLPQYKNKEDLKARLLKALQEKTGYHKIPEQ